MHPTTGLQPGFKVCGAKYILRSKVFVFIVCFNKKNSGHKKLGLKNWWGIAPVATGLPIDMDFGE